MGDMTTRAAIAESRAFASWQDYQEALKRAVAPLTDEQLAQRLPPSRRSPGEIAEHIVFGRALHLMRGSPADTLIEGESEVLRTIWGLLDHDLPHAGQLSLLLRAMGSPGVDI